LKRSRRPVMRGPTYPITVALALLLVAPPFSAFAQMGERGPSTDILRRNQISGIDARQQIKTPGLIRRGLSGRPS